MIKLCKIIMIIIIFSMFVGCGDKKVETNKMSNETVQLSKTEKSDEKKKIIEEEFNVTVEPKIKIDLENNKVLVYAIIDNPTEKELSNISFDLNYIDSDENIIESTPIQLEVNEESEILIGECTVVDYYGVRAENIECNFKESN